MTVVVTSPLVGVASIYVETTAMPQYDCTWKRCEGRQDASREGAIHIAA
jgi:hypothetical protein